VYKKNACNFVEKLIDQMAKVQAERKIITAVDLKAILKTVCGMDAAVERIRIY